MNYLKILTVAAAVAAMASCGGGSGAGKKIASNDILGDLPNIVYQKHLTDSTLDADEQAAGEKLGTPENDSDYKKAMKIIEEFKAKKQEAKEKYEADLQTELAKAAGREIPVTYSAALQSSGMYFYNAAAKLAGGEGKIAVAFTLSAKQDFTVPKYKNLDYYVYFRFTAADGSTLAKSVLPTVKAETSDKTYTAGTHLTDYSFPLRLSAKYADFTGIEFITSAEYNAP
jgi:hypothetical protein